MLRSPFIILLLLLNQQANGFVPAPRRKNIPSLLSESKSILDNILDKATSNNESTDKLLMDPLADMTTDADDAPSSWSYAEFAQTYPNVNNIGIATIKTASADLLAQVAIAHTPVSDIDWERAFLFCAFGAVYLGAFQYWYQVNIFKKVFDVDKFTSQSWGDKLKDT
mmetsp:Transcript_32942/g.56134  ORF Transcript_32942/g.56134 Transcript_32942/m.56134 type:complete len:167 (-) Transcript_32942:953-1453(-)